MEIISQPSNNYEIFEDENGVQYTKETLLQGIINHTDLTNSGFGGSDLEGVTIGFGKRAEAARALGFSEHPTEAECASKMTTISIETAYRGNLSLTIHKDLAAAIKQIFREIKQTGFDVYMVGGYCYRQINNPNNKSAGRPLSMHSFGCAIDINWDVNPFISKGRPYDSPPANLGNIQYNPRSCMWTYNCSPVRAMARHGFGWGGRYGDYMHFSTANGG